MSAEADTNVIELRPRRRASPLKQWVFIAGGIIASGGVASMLNQLGLVTIPWVKREELSAIEKRVERIETSQSDANRKLDLILERIK